VNAPAAATRPEQSIGVSDAVQAATLSTLTEHERLAPTSNAAMQEEPPADALSFAGEAAALACSRGADLPRREEVILASAQVPASRRRIP
jgi:sugar/nucleoside kinase (ribokinase family)